MEHRRGETPDAGPPSGGEPPGREGGTDGGVRGDQGGAGCYDSPAGARHRSGVIRAQSRAGSRTRSPWATDRDAATGQGQARQRRLPVLGAVGAALAVVLLAVGVVVFTGGDDGPPTTHPTTTGVSWTSGANANPPNDLGAWERWVGRPTDIAILFTARANWETVTRDDWPLADFRDYPGQLSIAQPLFPKDSNEAACARGDYDGHWRDFGDTLVRNGRPDAIVRLGWEFNGDWFDVWRPRDSGTWKACFTRAAAALRSTAPQVKIEWNMTAHRDTMVNGDGVWEAYPGDDVVDIIGIDAYDSYPASVTQKLFDEQCNRPSGVCTVARFAREHGKQFAVAEWGLDRRSGGGGDNPFYIEKMYEFFLANQDILAYEAYYSASPAENDNVASSLHNPATNPDSARRYLELFGGPRRTATGASGAAR
ncbi:glycoside hydrolase family 26 protein [Parafrankia elaeagni]|uniref:glycoside hydrolase family 26 protein n=1 Tax=Parafrankia elaeagni TaxID=222534 RepID=UPI0003A7A17C